MSESREAPVRTYVGTDTTSPARRRAWRIALVTGAVAVALSVLALAIGVRGGSEPSDADDSAAGGGSMPESAVDQAQSADDRSGAPAAPRKRRRP